MKVTEVSATDEDDYREYFAIKVNGKREVSFCDGEPEDNNMHRNFSQIGSISRLMKMAYDAGKNGEDFEIEEVKKEWGDWD
jgi:hypothetical protein